MASVTIAGRLFLRPCSLCTASFYLNELENGECPSCRSMITCGTCGGLDYPEHVTGPTGCRNCAYLAKTARPLDNEDLGRAHEDFDLAPYCGSPVNLTMQWLPAESVSTRADEGIDDLDDPYTCQICGGNVSIVGQHLCINCKDQQQYAISHGQAGGCLICHADVIMSGDICPEHE